MYILRLSVKAESFEIVLSVSSPVVVFYQTQNGLPQRAFILTGGVSLGPVFVRGPAKEILV